MKAIVVHFALDSEGGEYVRIKKNIALLENKGIYVTEVLLSKFTDISKITSSHPNRKRIVIPILIPGVSKMLISYFNTLLKYVIAIFLNYFIRPNVFWGETHGSAPLANYFKKKKIITFLDIHGALPEELLLSTNNTKLFEAYNNEEKKIFSGGYNYIFQSEAMIAHIERKHNLALPNSISYSCGFDESVFYFDEGLRKETREKLRITDDTILFIYSGGLHKWQKVEESLKIFSELKCINNGKHKLKFLILTKSDTTDLSKLANKLDVIDDIIFNSVNHNQVNAYLNAADFAFLLRDNIVVNEVASPTKFGEYLASGLTVLTTSIFTNWTSGKQSPYIINIENASANELYERLLKHDSSKAKLFESQNKIVNEYSLAYQDSKIFDFLKRTLNES